MKMITRPQGNDATYEMLELMKNATTTVAPAIQAKPVARFRLTDKLMSSPAV